MCPFQNLYIYIYLVDALRLTLLEVLIAKEKYIICFKLISIAVAVVTFEIVFICPIIYLRDNPLLWTVCQGVLVPLRVYFILIC